MNIYENIQHSMDIFDEVFISWRSIFLNLSVNWHLEFRYSTWIVLDVSLYYITRSFARFFTFFIFVEKHAFFNVLYSYFSRSLHLWVFPYYDAIDILQYYCQWFIPIITIAVSFL